MKRGVLVFIVALAGCTSAPAQYATLNEHVISLHAGDLEAAGIAFVTPASITVMRHERPEVKVVTLAETLSAVNRAGLVDAYRHMYQDYRDTALLPSEVLQLNLQGFTQTSKNRLGVLGLRLIDTQLGDVRLYFQIWDSRDGSLAWEGMQELRMAVDTTKEQPVTLRALLERTAHDLVAKVP